MRARRELSIRLFAPSSLSSPSFGLFPFTGCRLIPHPSCTNICLPLTLAGNPCIQISRRAKIPPLSVPGKINARARARIILTGLFRDDTPPRRLRAENNRRNSNTGNLQQWILHRTDLTSLLQNVYEQYHVRSNSHCNGFD